MKLEAPFGAASLAFGAFVIMRAVNVPLTYDEAAAYLRYISAGALSVFDFSVATNHLLNTGLTTLSAAVAGESALALRLPSLFGYALYLCFSALILRDLKHRVLAVAWFLVLNLNPYVLEYFALSRGYGLSLGLMMGSVFFLSRFLRQLNAGITDWRPAARSLLFASAATLANFAILNVYLALLAVMFLWMVLHPRADGGGVLRLSGLTANWTRMLTFVAATTVYTALVFSQDPNLSPELYESVTVKIAASDSSTLEDVRVFRIDHRGRREPLRRGGDSWSLERTGPFAGIRIELPVTAADTLRSVEAAVGRHVFTYDRAVQALWTSIDADGVRALESNAALSLPRSKVRAFRGFINWRGDSQYAAHLATSTAVVILVAGAIALLLAAAGWLIVRSNLIAADGWRTLSTSALWTGALVGPPLYLLRRNGELYYGGVSGLIEDTFYSCINGSFYGKLYHPNQTPIAFAAILSSTVFLSLVLAFSGRRKGFRDLAGGVSLLAIMAIVSVGVVAQRLLFDTPYLLGRTAIFYIPLCLLFLAAGADALSELGRAGRAAAGIFTTLIVSFSLYHFQGTANLKSSFDWPQDAATKLMIADVAEITSGERPSGSRVSLGVDWVYYPVAVYYARRSNAPIDIHVLPAKSDFVYVEDVRRSPAGQVLRKYARTGSALVRVGG